MRNYAIKQSLIALCLIGTVGFMFYILRVCTKKQNVERQPSENIIYQRRVVTAYSDSVMTCHSSRLNYYGDMLEIESAKLSKMRGGR